MADEIKAVRDVLEAFGLKVVSELGKSLDYGKDSSGALRESIKFEIKLSGGGYRFELSMLDYYKWVDEGRKPGKFPPPDAIKKWLSIKPLHITDKKLAFATKKGLKVIANDIQKIKTLAFLIGRKIAKEGIKPTHFYSSVVTPELISKLKSDLQAAIKKDIMIEITQA